MPLYELLLYEWHDQQNWLLFLKWINLVAHQVHWGSNPLSVHGGWFGRCTGFQSPPVGPQVFVSYSLGYELNVVFISHRNISFLKSWWPGCNLTMLTSAKWIKLLCLTKQNSDRIPCCQILQANGSLAAMLPCSCGPSIVMRLCNCIWYLYTCMPFFKCIHFFGLWTKLVCTLQLCCHAAV